jgi:hypothetical protein
MIGVVTGPGSCIVALLGAVFGLFKHYQRKKDPPKNSCQKLVLKGALQIPSQPRLVLSQSLNPNTLAFFVSGGLGDV